MNRDSERGVRMRHTAQRTSVERGWLHARFTARAGAETVDVRWLACLGALVVKFSARRHLQVR